jgi:hypothetical protein
MVRSPRSGNLNGRKARRYWAAEPHQVSERHLALEPLGKPISPLIRANISTAV